MMEKKRIRIILILGLILVMLLSFFSIKSLATDSNMLMVKENDNKYLIYIEDLLNENFEFAFSNSEDSKRLNYISSAKDNDGNSIAYVDEELKQNFFNSEDTYLWVKTNENVVINGEKIVLNNAKTIEQLKTIESITKTITVKANAEDKKIKVNGEKGEEYYYQIFVPGSSETYNRLLILINEVSKYDENTNTFKRLKNYNELYDLYNSLLQGLDSDDWAEARNMDITKPYDAKKGEQYVLWLKDSKGNVDVQILTAYEKEITVVEKRENTEEIITALPVTYDDMTVLYVALGVVGLAILAILVYKVKSRKDRD